jgi:ubiquinone biosynthesis protein
VTTIWSLLARLLHLAAVVAVHALRALLGAVGRRLPILWRRLPAAPSRPRQLRLLLQDLGGTFIKFGQVLALQPDLVPRRFRDELFDLMDRVPPFSFAAAEKLFFEELGETPSVIFDSFNEAPIASASVAQVHVARLDGRKLAVKVQRPRARREFGGDVLLMGAVASWIRRFGLKRLFWLALALEEFIAWTAEELDFRAEARFMDRLAANSRDRERERVPDVMWPLTTARVLTAEFLEGVTLLRYLRGLEEGSGEGARPPDDFDPERFAENLLDNFLHDVFHHGVFHSDLHPANLLILPDNSVGYVDFGISGVVSEHARFHLVSAIQAVSRGDVGTLADHLLEIIELESGSDPEGFRRGLEELGDRWFRREPGRRRLETRCSYTEILLDTLRLSRQRNTLCHPEAMRYMRSVVTLDGLIERFAPGLDRDRALERSTRKLLESSALAAPFSFDRWVDWLWAGSSLMRDGAERIDRALDRVERWSARERGEPDRRRERRSGPMPLAVSTLALALLVVLPAESPRFGLNLFTVEMGLIGLSLVLLARELLEWRPFRR